MKLPQYLYSNRKTECSVSSLNEFPYYQPTKTAIKTDKFKSISCGGMILTTGVRSTLCRGVALKRRECILLSGLLLYLSLRLSLCWKWNSLCGWRDLEQTPRRLRLVALGRSALWSRKVYEEPVVRLYALPRSHKIWLHSNSGSLSQALYSSTRTQTHCWQQPTFLSWQWWSTSSFIDSTKITSLTSNKCSKRQNVFKAKKSGG